MIKEINNINEICDFIIIFNNMKELLSNELCKIYGIEKKDLLLDYHINDMWIVPAQTNLFGGMGIMTFPFCMNRIYEWWKSKAQNDKMIFINDDPEVCKLWFFIYHTKRYAIKKDVKMIWKQGVNKDNWKTEIDLLESRYDDICNMENDFDLAFCGLDYDKYVKENRIKILPKSWFNFNVYYYITLNDDLALRMRNYDFDDKKYSA